MGRELFAETVTRKDAGASPMDGRYLLLQYLHFLHPYRSVHCVSQQVVTGSCLGLFNRWLMPTILPFVNNNKFFNWTAVIWHMNIYLSELCQSSAAVIYDPHPD